MKFLIWLLLINLALAEKCNPLVYDYPQKYYVTSNFNELYFQFVNLNNPNDPNDPNIMFFIGRAYNLGYVNYPINSSKFEVALGNFKFGF
jgi:hypothetical protein